MDNAPRTKNLVLSEELIELLEREAKITGTSVSAVCRKRLKIGYDLVDPPLGLLKVEEENATGVQGIGEWKNVFADDVLQDMFIQGLIWQRVDKLAEIGKIDDSPNDKLTAYRILSAQLEERLSAKGLTL